MTDPQPVTGIPSRADAEAIATALENEFPDWAADIVEEDGAFSVIPRRR